MRSSRYSNTLQMYKQWCTFNVIETCTVTNYGNVEFRTKLLDEIEGKSINNCLETNALKTQLSNVTIILAHTATTRKRKKNHFIIFIFIFFI